MYLYIKFRKVNKTNLSGNSVYVFFPWIVVEV